MSLMVDAESMCQSEREREMDEFTGLFWVPAIFSVRSKIEKKTRRKKKEGARDKGTEQGQMKCTDERGESETGKMNERE